MENRRKSGKQQKLSTRIFEVHLKDLQRIKTGVCVTSSYILSHRELQHMETKVNLPASTALKA